MILWVDDDITFSLDAFVDELKEEGFTILEAKNPDEMWENLKNQEENIEAIIMDIMMPTGKTIDKSKSRMGSITGLILADELKNKSSKYNKIPIIIFTILSDQDVQDWADTNNVPLLKKQHTYPEELVTALKQALRKRK